MTGGVALGRKKSLELPREGLGSLTGALVSFGAQTKEMGGKGPKKFHKDL